MYSDRERSSDDLSPETSEFSHSHPVDAVATSELSPALKTGSIVALIIVLFGTLVGSLAVSPRPTAMEAEEEIEEAVATDEPAMEEMEEVEEVVTTPAASVTEDETATGDAPADTETPASDSTTPATNTAETPAPTTPTETAGTATTAETPASDATTPATNTAETPAPTPEDGEMADTAAETPTPTPEDGEMAGTPEMGADTAAETPVPTPEDGEMAAATGAADVEQLNQIVYDKLDRAWTVQGTPVTSEVSYLVTVTPEGAIAKFEPNSPDAEDNLDNTPLPGLAEADGMTGETSGQTVTFEVMFSDTGALEVKPSQ